MKANFFNENGEWYYEVNGSFFAGYFSSLAAAQEDAYANGFKI